MTDIVRRNGVAGNWVWWAFVLTGVSTVFFYARLWRRSGVMTDLEFYELRYSGTAASALRGFRAVYLGLLFNCMIMATVNLAACKIAGILFGLDRWQTLLFVGVLNAVFAAHAGLWGVLVIDMIQFFIKMTAVIAAAYFAVNAPQVGGLHNLIQRLSSMPGPGGLNYLNFLPDFRNNWDLAVAVFMGLSPVRRAQVNRRLPPPRGSPGLVRPRSPARAAAAADSPNRPIWVSLLSSRSVTSSVGSTAPQRVQIRSRKRDADHTLSGELQKRSIRALQERRSHRRHSIGLFLRTLGP